MTADRSSVSKHQSLLVMFVIHAVSVALLASVSHAYFANWGDVGRAHEPTCVDIPSNISLCSNIQYKRMRLPNLLAHDTLNEVAHQSSSWVPLLNVRCHPDTQLFLCSLFTPVCLESPIYPCRSLCIAVQRACENRMTTYGYSWPDMLSCDNFPEDNDMCVMSLHSVEDIEEDTKEDQTDSPEEAEAAQAVTPGSTCDVCNPVSTYENILDNFCRADFVMRVKIRTVRNQRLIVRKARVYKPAIKSSEEDQTTIRGQRQALRRPNLHLIEDASCCTEALVVPSGRYLVMGKNTSEGLVPTFVMPWTRQKSMREAARLFVAGLDCSDPSLFTPDQQSGAILNTSNATRGRGGGGEGGGRRRGGNGGGGRKRDREGRRSGRRGRRRGGRGGRNKVEEGERRRGGREGRRRGGGGREAEKNLKKGVKRKNRKRDKKRNMRRMKKVEGESAVSLE